MDRHSSSFCILADFNCRKVVTERTNWSQRETKRRRFQTCSSCATSSSRPALDWIARKWSASGWQWRTSSWHSRSSIYGSGARFLASSTTTSSPKWNSAKERAMMRKRKKRSAHELPWMSRAFLVSIYLCFCHVSRVGGRKLQTVICIVKFIKRAGVDKFFFYNFNIPALHWPC